MRTSCAPVGLLFLVFGVALLPSASQSRCLAQGQWAYGSCSTTYTTRTYNYSGYGAAAAYALQALSNYQAQEDQRAAEAQRAADAQRAAEIARRNAICHANWQNAFNLTDQANRLWDQNWDPAAAIPLYQQAISYLRPCGDTRNIAIVQSNLAKAQKEYAAVAPDNRIEEANRKYKDQSVYNQPNPFSASRKNDKTDCLKAFEFGIDQYYECVDKRGGSTTTQRPPYRHPIDPQSLFVRAVQPCLDNNRRARRSCVTAEKVKILFASDPQIREKCSRLSGDDQLECVNQLYLYGPEGPPDNPQKLKELLRNRLAQDQAYGKRINALAEKLDALPVGNPYRKALEDEIERLTEERFSPNKASVDKNEPVEEQRLPTAAQRLENVARASVAAAIALNNTKLSEQDQNECGVVAYEAVRAALSGFGNPKVPDKCRAVVYDAVTQLAYQAAAQIDVRSTPDEDLLQRYLAMRNPNSGGQNDGMLGPPPDDTFVGLQPTARQRKEIDDEIERLRNPRPPVDPLDSKENTFNPRPKAPQ